MPPNSATLTDGRRRRARSIQLGLVLLLIAGALLGWEYGLASTPSSTAPTNPGASGPVTQGPSTVGARGLDPSFCASGSCVSFPPTSGDRHETVFLDAGHGGVDPGGVGVAESGKTIYEADETLAVELDTMALLRATGFTVVVSRTRASTVLRLSNADLSSGVLSLAGAHNEVAARDICANDAKANVLVGIYFDAGASPQAAGCVTTYDAARPFSAANLRLAKLLQHAELAKLNAKGWGIPNDGVLTDVGMGSSNGNPSQGGLAAEALAYDHVMLIGPAKSGFFSTPSTMPGAVIEPLYITDPFEGSIANSAAGQSALAAGLAAGIEAYFR